MPLILFKKDKDMDKIKWRCNYANTKYNRNREPDKEAE